MLKLRIKIKDIAEFNFNYIMLTAIKNKCTFKKK